MDPGWRQFPGAITVDELAVWAPHLRSPVALTGATGFVGSHLAEALSSVDIDLRVLVRDEFRLVEMLRRHERVEVVRGDLSNPSVLRAFVRRAGTVLHVAGLVRAAGARTFDAVNRVGTANIVAALERERCGATLVYVSSLAASGPSPSPDGRSPDDDPRPISAYGRSKLAGELEVRKYCGDWCIVRPPAVYGPRDTDVLQFFRMAARGWVPIPGGHRWVTLAHVSDVVRGILAAAVRGGGGTWHLGEPFPHTMEGVVAVLSAAGHVRARTVGLPATVVHLGGACGSLLQRFGFTKVALTADKARELTARHWTADSAGSLRALGLDGFVPFAKGARSTWDWYRSHGWVPHATISGREQSGQ